MSVNDGDSLERARRGPEGWPEGFLGGADCRSACLRPEDGATSRPVRDLGSTEIYRLYDAEAFGGEGGGAATRADRKPRLTDVASAATVMPAESARLK